MVNKNTECRIMLAACYLPPENSKWGSDSDTYFNHLLSE